MQVVFLSSIFFLFRADADRCEEDVLRGDNNTEERQDKKDGQMADFDAEKGSGTSAHASQALHCSASYYPPSSPIAIFFPQTQ